VADGSPAAGDGMTPTEATERGITRRRFLGRSAAAAGSLWLGGMASGARAAQGPPPSLAGMNVVMFVTDQERAIQHFPPGWSERNLPGLTQLQRHGVTFDNAFTNACMCSPARSTLMSGFFPAQHGVKYTLEADMQPPAYPQVVLPTPTSMANIATVMSAAGYNVIYKGKWHCSKPAGATWSPSDLSDYGFSRWNPADAGANQSIPEMGGGIANNDGRFMTSVGDYTAGDEGALQFLTSAAASKQPFFMIISLVNPHDVLEYPRNYAAAGYSGQWLEGQIGLPPTLDEDLSLKPRAQEAFLKIYDLSGKLRTSREQRNYINFYANLMRASDNFLVNVLAALDSVSTSSGASLSDNTLVIRTSDHGEMGLAHGGLREKNFNFYEETLRVPLVYSNPRLFRRPRRSNALVSHVDFLPTLASLFAAPQSARSAWQGRDYSSHILQRRAAPVQDYIVFTYDDYQSGQSHGPYVPPPQHIVSIRETRWKIAQYYDPAGTVRPEWEMYDLATDPLETTNLARPGYPRTGAENAQLARLRRKLATVQATRLQPL
jgi:choline-sulfatase